MDQLVYGNTMLKVVVMVQIVFTTWAYLIPPYGSFLPETYSFMHLILFLFGALSIAKPSSSDMVLMYLLMNMYTILNDIILLSLYQPLAGDYFESQNHPPRSGVNTYRFALGMSIVNLIMKPLFCFVLYRIYMGRGGNIHDELTGIRGSGQSGYDNIDDSSRPVETASPHQRLDNST